LNLDFKKKCRHFMRRAQDLSDKCRTKFQRKYRSAIGKLWHKPYSNRNSRAFQGLQKFYNFQLFFESGLNLMSDARFTWKEPHMK
jgi:hypothetical protein